MMKKLKNINVLGLGSQNTFEEEFLNLNDEEIDYMNDETFDDEGLKEWNEEWHEKYFSLAKDNQNSLPHDTNFLTDFNEAPPGKVQEEYGTNVVASHFDYDENFEEDLIANVTSFVLDDYDKKTSLPPAYSRTPEILDPANGSDPWTGIANVDDGMRDPAILISESSLDDVSKPDPYTTLARSTYKSSTTPADSFFVNSELSKLQSFYEKFMIEASGLSSKDVSKEPDAFSFSSNFPMFPPINITTTAQPPQPKSALEMTARLTPRNEKVATNLANLNGLFSEIFGAIHPQKTSNSEMSFNSGKSSSLFPPYINKDSGTGKNNIGNTRDSQRAGRTYDTDHHSRLNKQEDENSANYRSRNFKDVTSGWPVFPLHKRPQGDKNCSKNFRDPANDQNEIIAIEADHDTHNNYNPVKSQNSARTVNHINGQRFRNDQFGREDRSLRPRLKSDSRSRNVENNRADPYADLMSKKEKNLILKIQLFQLQCDNPYLEDYYYAMSTMKHMLTKEKDVVFTCPTRNESPYMDHCQMGPNEQKDLLLFDISKFIVPSKDVDIFHNNRQQIAPTESAEINSDDKSGVLTNAGGKEEKAKVLENEISLPARNEERQRIDKDSNNQIIGGDQKNGDHSFGKQSFATIHQPHVLLDIESRKNLAKTAKTANSDTPTDLAGFKMNIVKYRQLLLFIENLYSELLDIDDPQRKLIALSRGQTKTILNSTGELKIISIFQKIFPHYDDDDDDKTLNKTSDIEKNAGGPKNLNPSLRFVQMLCVNKGKTLVVRLIPYLNVKCFLYLMTQILRNASILAKCNLKDQGALSNVNLALFSYIVDDQNLEKFSKSHVTNILRTLNEFYSAQSQTVLFNLSNKFIFCLNITILLWGVKMTRQQSYKVTNDEEIYLTMKDSVAAFTKYFSKLTIVDENDLIVVKDFARAQDLWEVSKKHLEDVLKFCQLYNNTDLFADKFREKILK
ncbi:unnamed protein product [Gordionus sp. m RMFG-2023]